MNKRGKQNQLSEKVCGYMVEAKCRPHISNWGWEGREGSTCVTIVALFPGNAFPFPILETETGPVSVSKIGNGNAGNVFPLPR